MSLLALYLFLSMYFFELLFVLMSAVHRLMLCEVTHIIKMVVMVCLSHLFRKNESNHKEICLRDQSSLKNVEFSDNKMTLHLICIAYP
jgi:hypothetical protein